MQGSKSAYFAPLERMFCSAPIITASISGVVPNLNKHNPYSKVHNQHSVYSIQLYYSTVKTYFAVMGAKKAGKRLSEKKAMPEVSRVSGVISAAAPQPKRRNTTRPTRKSQTTAE